MECMSEYNMHVCVKTKADPSLFWQTNLQEQLLQDCMTYRVLNTPLIPSVCPSLIE